MKCFIAPDPDSEGLVASVHTSQTWRSATQHFVHVEQSQTGESRVPAISSD